MAKQMGKKVCPECGSSMKPENYSRHMRKVHGSSAGGQKENQRDKKKRIEQEKREAARLQKKNKTVTTSILLVVIIGIGIAGVFIVMNLSGGGHEGYQPINETPNTNTGTSSVAIPVNGITNSAQFHTYNSNGVTVRYFLARGSDGQVHIAADACDVCYDNKRGYKQTGDVMTCNNCGQEFSINSIGTDNIAGGCWPSYIPMSINSGDVIIQNSALDAKSYMFN